MLFLKEPNLFIIGAMKSGTSSLHLYLNEHPDIFMCQPKEPSYFVESNQLKAYWKNMWEKGYWKSIEDYQALFKDANSSKIIGESSTTYSKYPRLTGVAKNIKAFNPEAKLIYIMRDPIERTISHYWHNVRWEGETKKPLTAIKINSHYREVSMYALQLKQYLKFFDIEQIYTITIEEFQSNTEKNIQQIFEWLGVEKSFIPVGLNKKDHVTPDKIRQTRGMGILNKFRHSLVWESINHFFPKKIKQFARQISDPPVIKSDVDVGEVVEFLRPMQIKETEELESLLGKKFPEWKTLYNRTAKKA
ncbi:sulfotransferase [Desulfobacula sp.]|uniref:sulfotransferase family protein n=1 Tax=Desulfobacula sp. TaxID=2593537 RepID=UPI0026339222|nr:sulfotransferase [Desulfobacula sp.]